MSETPVRVGFIGGGRVTRCLVVGWLRQAQLPAEILVCDPDDGAVAKLTAACDRIRRVALDEAAAADVVFLALHPPLFATQMSAVKPHLLPDAIVVSLAPKVPMSALVAGLGTPHVARMIPNAPSIVGRGYNPVTFADGVGTGARTLLARLFDPWGAWPEVPEPTLEAYAILSAMGPTYFWYQWQALREVSGQLGLTDEQADTALRQMIDGAVDTLLASGLSPADVIDLVPVKPLQDLEPTVREAYRTALPVLFAKIRPAV